MKLFNTPHKAVEEVMPQNSSVVTVYSCGPTVYDYPHIGNWFTFIRYDLLVRSLRINGLQPKWVMNITDVGHLVSDADEGEDKLEKGAKREGRTAWEIAKFYTDNFHAGLRKLNFSPVDELPRATDHITAQIELVKALEAKNYTYVIDDGVYFDTSKFANYAKFASLQLDQQTHSHRVEVNPQKRQASDFAIWKFSPKDQQRDMEWDSPWGKGFPGWHLECSAMSMKYLGSTIDIHAGGIDHIPVHHTNEVAQSEAATGQQFVNYWFHANHILVNNQKIAKSLGNGITLEDIEAKGFAPLAVRLLTMESHYRSQAEFSWDVLAAAQNRLKDLQAFADLRHQDDDTAAPLSNNYFDKLSAAIKEELSHDLDTPGVMKLLSETADDIKAHGQGISPVNATDFENFLIFLDDALGLQLSQRPDLTREQKAQLSARHQARETKDWAQADAIREQLQQQGIGINDTDYGQIWYRL